MEPYSAGDITIILVLTFLVILLLLSNRLFNWYTSHKKKDPSPWLKGTKEGSLYVDTSNKEWQERFKKKVEEHKNGPTMVDNGYFKEVASGHPEVVVIEVKVGGYFGFHKTLPGLCSSSFSKEDIVAKIMRHKQEYKDKLRDLSGE